MARAVYPHELQDPDFAWLIDSFKEHHPEFLMVDSACLSVTFIKEGNKEIYKELMASQLPVPFGPEGFDIPFDEEDEDDTGEWGKK